MIIALKSAWHRLSGSQTVKLLILEFIVVLSGVLLAQVLQAWLVERSERQTAKAQLEGVVAAMHNSAELAIIRPRINMCMRDAIERVRDILADSAADRSDLDWLEVPEQMVLDETGIDSARPLLRRHYENDVIVTLSSAEFMNAYMRSGQDDELKAWSTLKLLRPENGPIDDEVRGQLLIALGEAERANRLLNEVSGVMYTRAQQMQIPTHQPTIDAIAASPKLCMNMAGFDGKVHGAALTRGELPDGRPLHPRVLAQLAAAQ
jgi:hypothetical protein